MSTHIMFSIWRYDSDINSIIEPQGAPTEDSDQPAYIPSLNRILVTHIKKLDILGYLDSTH